MCRTLHTLLASDVSWRRLSSSTLSIVQHVAFSYILNSEELSVDGDIVTLVRDLNEYMNMVYTSTSHAADSSTILKRYVDNVHSARNFDLTESLKINGIATIAERKTSRSD